MDFSISPLAALVVGGSGTFVGPLIGTVILLPVSELLRAFPGLRTIFYSMLITLFIIYWREGLLNWARKKYEQFEYFVEV
jgi:branched-chain amino acid transport system permease protein